GRRKACRTAIRTDHARASRALDVAFRDRPAARDCEVDSSVPRCVQNRGRAPVTTRQRSMAATLWGGDNSATSHGSASGLLQLRDLRLPGMHLTIAADAGGRLP